ncbi:MAG: diguanylate cyclase [Burkholderiales bacterium]
MQAVTISEASGVDLPLRAATLWRGLRAAALQLLLIGSAVLLVPLVPVLPSELSGMHQYGPYLALAVAGAIGASFNRGRAILSVLLLTLAYALFARGVSSATETGILVATLLPLNLAVIALLRERGVASRYALRRFVAFGLEFIVATWLVSGGTWLWICHTWPQLVLPPSVFSLPPIVVGALCVSTIVTAAVLWIRGNAIDAALFAAVIACEAGAILSGTPNAYGLMIGAAATVLAVGVLQDAYRYAFVDELTGLGGRRALNERLLALGERYVIAMVDVDHFKQVNDIHGHDTGDQVLRMIATHLARTGSGARSYRYGGEEFAVVFPGKSSKDVIPALERLRTTVESYRMLLRAEDRRPHDNAEGVERRSTPTPAGAIQVTISIGVAEPDPRSPASPEQVLRAADEALYRAKERGRNRLSR